jgi:hypothetical protein
MLLIHEEEEEDEEEDVVSVGRERMATSARDATSVKDMVTIRMTVQQQTITIREKESSEGGVKIYRVVLVVATEEEWDSEVVVAAEWEVEQAIKDPAIRRVENTMAKCIIWKKKEDESLGRYWKVKKKKETLRRSRIFIKGCQNARGNPRGNKDGI